MKRINTVLAVAKKDFIQLVRYPTWPIGLVVWPLIFPLLYILSAYGYAGPSGSGIKAFEAATGTDSFEGFIVIGTMTWMWINITMWNFGGFLRDEQERGTLESNWLCPINRFDFLFGGGIVTLFTCTLMTVVSIIEYRFIYGINFTGNVLQWIVVYLSMLPAVYGLGLTFASVVLWAKEVGATVNVVRGIIMILCGITFPIAVMPGWMQGISKYIPITHGIEAARQVMINGISLTGASKSIMLCLIEGIVIFIIGRLIFIKVESRVKMSGSLERF